MHIIIYYIIILYALYNMLHNFMLQQSLNDLLQHMFWNVWFVVDLGQHMIRWFVWLLICLFIEHCFVFWSRCDWPRLGPRPLLWLQRCRCKQILHCHNLQQMMKNLYELWNFWRASSRCGGWGWWLLSTWLSGDRHWFFEVLRAQG